MRVKTVAINSYSKLNPLPGASKSPAVEKFGDSIYWTVGVSGVGGSGFYRVDTNGDNFL